MENSIKTIFLLLLWTTCAKGILAQKPYFAFFQQETFFGHLPGARAEAMGRADVALGGTATSYYYNPAGIGTIQDWEFVASTSGPFYVLANSDYHSVSYVRRINDVFAAGINLHQFASADTLFQFNIGGGRYPVQRPRVDDFSLTLAATPLDGLHVGVNVHFFNWKVFDDVSSFRAFYFDAGALYVLPLSEKARLQFGGSVVNALGNQVNFEGPDGRQGSNWFPIVGRLGGAFIRESEMDLPGLDNPVPINYTLTLEGQNLFNAEFRSAVRLGFETVVANLLAVRFGWYTRSEDDMGVATNKDRIFDPTYGFGLIVPTYELSQGKIPFVLHLDYYSLRNPPVIENPTRRSNKRGFAIRLVAPLSDN